MPQIEPDSGRGRAGQVKTIRVENFMCHEHLKVEFKYAPDYAAHMHEASGSVAMVVASKILRVRPGCAANTHCLLQAVCQLHFWDQRLWQECDASGPAILPGRGCSADRAGPRCQGPHQVWRTPAGGLRDALEHRCGLSAATRLRPSQRKGVRAEPVAVCRVCPRRVWCSEHDWACRC